MAVCFSLFIASSEPSREPVKQRLTPKPKAAISPSTQNSPCDPKGTPLLHKCQEQEQETKVNDVPISQTERAEAAWP